jgi:predicted ester cyclase
MTKRVTVPGAFVVHYTADNKVDEMWNFMDQANVMMQIGMIPGLPEGFTPVPMPEQVEIVKGEATPGMAEAYKAFGDKMKPDTFEAAVAEMMHDEFTMVDFMTGKTVAKAELNEHMKQWLGMFADHTTTVDKDLAAGNYYVALTTMTGTYKGGIPGAEANDQKVTMHELSVSEMVDGKFKSYAGYANGLELAAQLGLMGGAAEKPAGEDGAVAAGGDTLGVAECDLYISKMRECMGSLPDAARGAFENGMKTALDQWKQSITAGGDAAKSALGQACKSTLDAAKQAAGQLCPDVKWE